METEPIRRRTIINGGEETDANVAPMASDMDPQLIELLRGMVASNKGDGFASLPSFEPMTFRARSFGLSGAAAWGTSVKPGDLINVEAVSVVLTGNKADDLAALNWVEQPAGAIYLERPLIDANVGPSYPLVLTFVSGPEAYRQLPIDAGLNALAVAVLERPGMNVRIA